MGQGNRMGRGGVPIAAPGTDPRGVIMPADPRLPPMSHPDPMRGGYATPGLAAPRGAEWRTAAAVLASRLEVTSGEAEVILARLSLPALIRAVPEGELRRLAGLR
jgi:hypothetical protein